ncbi:MAG: hypothetical protein P8N80_03070 [Planktomarina sp.]|jgi:hypothetical protein|nr:hypothetical protein [Planktomarina sp.]
MPQILMTERSPKMNGGFAPKPKIANPSFLSQHPLARTTNSSFIGALQSNLSAVRLKSYKKLILILKMQKSLRPQTKK